MLARHLRSNNTYRLVFYVCWLGCLIVEALDWVNHKKHQIVYVFRWILFIAFSSTYNHEILLSSPVSYFLQFYVYEGNILTYISNICFEIFLIVLFLQQDKGSIKSLAEQMMDFLEKFSSLPLTPSSQEIFLNVP